MSKKPKKVASDVLGKPVHRRQALRGIGAMAVAGPIAAACSSDDNDPVGSGTGGAGTSTGGTASGGIQATGGTPAATGGTPQTFGGTPGSGGTKATGGTSPTGGTPATGGTTGGTQAAGGTSAGGPSTTGGAGAGPGGGAGGTNGGAPSGGQGGISAGGGSGGPALEVPPFDDVPMCTASKTDGAGQGPFFIHELEKSDDISIVRQDIRGRYKMDAEPGVEMQLHLRILSSKSDCTPVPDVEVYIWHTDGQGYYSGFGEPGQQKPDEPYAGVPGQNDLDNTDRFCRGMQITDANGVVSFRSIFPGWYNGRDLHIHFVALKKGSASRGRMMYSGDQHLFTTQFYFDPAFSDMVHQSTEPYLRRTKISAYQGAIEANEPGNSQLKAKATFTNNIVVAQMQIVLDPKT